MMEFSIHKRSRGYGWSMLLLWMLCFYLFLHGTDASEGNSYNNKEVESHSVKKNGTQGYKLVSFNFEHVEMPSVICLWILLASIAKIGE